MWTAAMKAVKGQKSEYGRQRGRKSAFFLFDFYRFRI